MRTYLKQLREQQEMLQKVAAIKCGMPPTTYCMIENGDRQTDMALSIMQKLAAAFEISVEELMLMEADYRLGRPPKAG